MIDIASAYGNEEEIGETLCETINDSIIEREDLLVITKIYHGSEMANSEQAIQACLDRLNIGYVDIMLLHHIDINASRTTRLYRSLLSKAKYSLLIFFNWYIKEVDGFIAQIDTIPALIQNEIERVGALDSGEIHDWY